jgi:hypothetical protein
MECEQNFSGAAGGRQLLFEKILAAAAIRTGITFASG